MGKLSAIFGFVGIVVMAWLFAAPMFAPVTEIVIDDSGLVPMEKTVIHSQGNPIIAWVILIGGFIFALIVGLTWWDSK